MYGFDGAGIDDMHVCPNCGQTGDITHQGGCVPQDEEHHEPGNMLPVGGPVTPTDICAQAGCPHLGQPMNTHCGRCTLPHGVAAKPRQPRLSLTCPVVVVPPVPATGLGIGAVKRAVLCDQPAVVVILTETDYGACCCGDHFEHEVLAWPVCADHAPEEVHEARCSMDESEFLVLDLPTTKEN